jgi:hypothetical protein
MKELIDKIEDYVFDFLGLVLPGFIFLLLAATPLLLFDYTKIDLCVIEKSKILSILVYLTKYVDYVTRNTTQLTILLVVLLSYIIGHLAKVLSIIQYEFLKAFFDNLICELLSKIKEWIKTFTKWLLDKIYRPDNKFRLKISKIYMIIYHPFHSLYIKIFQFKAPDYFPDNEILKTECISIINSKFKTQFPSKWYSLYKFSTVMHNQEKIKSLSLMFLAKYNFYRSLAFILSLIFIYYLIFFNTTYLYLSKNILSLKELIMVTIFLLWFTFHYKYKRYWTLCGNETLVSLYYFLKKNNNG